MKTLQKLTLMAFAMLSAGVANAQSPQCINCTPPTITAPKHNVDPGCRTCALGPNELSVPSADRPNMLPSSSSSSVFQRGASQFACVEQIGFNNTADLIQAPGRGKSGGNNAYQTQRGAAQPDKDNVLYGNQSGNGNLLVQNQNGYDLLGRATQSGNNNLAYQDQGGHTNSAYVTQSGTMQASIQYQRGSGNTSDVYQHGNDSWAGTNQAGTNNVVSINQH